MYGPGCGSLHPRLIGNAQQLTDVCVYEALLVSGQISRGREAEATDFILWPKLHHVSLLSYTPRTPIAPRCSLGQYYRQGNAFRQSWSLRISRLRRKSNRVPCGTDGQQATITRSFRAVYVLVGRLFDIRKCRKPYQPTHTRTQTSSNEEPYLGGSQTFSVHKVLERRNREPSRVR